MTGTAFVLISADSALSLILRQQSQFAKVSPFTKQPAAACQLPRPLPTGAEHTCSKRTLAKSIARFFRLTTPETTLAFIDCHVQREAT
jgi:hypothetical protein